MSKTPPDDWLQTALEVTGHFEDSSDPLAAVTPNFDGMGVSLGVLQWNLGSRSLQPLVKALGKSRVQELMPNYGRELWLACESPMDKCLAIARSWHSGTVLLKPVKSELKALARSSDFVAQQIAASRDVGSRALADAEAWAAADPAYQAVTKALFCWFFDVRTQNGGLKGLTYDSVDAFGSAYGNSTADDFVCDWLAQRPSGEAGVVDGRANAQLWRDKVPPARLSLFLLSFMRSQRSNPQWRTDVLNRKGTLALGSGWVHREKHDLSGLLGM